jgi:hypothetical protein
VPVAFVTESSATITSPTESSSAWPLDILSAAIDRDYTPIIGEYVVPRMIVDNGSKRWICSFEFDYTASFKLYGKKVSEYEIEGESLPQFVVGLIYFGPDDGSALGFYQTRQLQLASRVRPRGAYL